MAEESENVRLTREIIRLVSAYEFDAIAPLLHEDIVQECPYQAFHQGPMVRGRANVMNGIRFVPQVFEKFNLNIHAVYDCPGQNVVVFEMTSFGILAIGGGIYQNRYVMVFEFCDSKLILWREFFNPEIMNASMAFMLDANS